MMRAAASLIRLLYMPNSTTLRSFLTAMVNNISAAIHTHYNIYTVKISVFLSFTQTPGPGAYNTTKPDIFKDQAPVYSMTSRNVMPGDATQQPGPGAHTICVSLLCTMSAFIQAQELPYMPCVCSVPCVCRSAYIPDCL